jgi:hypothetical protein
MPRINSRGNFAGIDSRPGFADSSLNSCSDMRNIQLRDKAITKRLGHQKVHTDAAKRGSLLFDSEDASTVDLSTLSLTSAGGWSYEFAFRLSGVPSAVTRVILTGPLNAQVTSAGTLQVGSDTGGGAVLLNSATTIAANTTYFVSVTYDPAGAGTLILYLDGSSDATNAAYGTPNTPDATQDLELGSVVQSADGAFLWVSELRIWDDTRTPTEVDDWDGMQLPPAIYGDANLDAYWRLDEGGGNDISEIVGSTTQTIRYDPYATGIIKGSSGSVAIMNLNESASASQYQNVADWDYFLNANDMTWEFNVVFTDIPSGVSPGFTYVLAEIYDPTVATQGVRFEVQSPGASANINFRFTYTDSANPGTDNILLTEVFASKVAGRVYHVALTVDRNVGVDRTANMYIDGVLAAGPTAVVDTDGANTTSGTNLTLDIVKLTKTSGDESVDYAIDEMRLWDEVRTVTQIDLTKERTLYDNEITDELVGYWKFDDQNRAFFLSEVDGDAGANMQFTYPPHMSFTQYPFSNWGFGLVTPEAGRITGAHNYLTRTISKLVGDGSKPTRDVEEINNLNEVLVHTPGATYMLDDDANTLTALEPYSPDGNVPVASQQFGSRMYFANGEDFPWRYDASDLNRAGIAPPGTSPQLLASVGGPPNDYPVGTYDVAYTYISTQGTQEYESPLSPRGTFTLGAAAQQLRFVNIFASDDPQVDGIQIYITEADGDDLFKVESFDNTDAVSAATAKFVDATAEADLSVAATEGISEPLKFNYMVERDGRMIWAGGPNSSTQYFWSDVDEPEVIRPLNFRSHVEEITGLAVGPNNELYVFGRTTRTVIFGDINDTFTPARLYRDGGSLSHNALEKISGWIYGIGPDGPFRCNQHLYVPIDETNFNGQVISSIRDKLEDETNKDDWDLAQSSYNKDRKTWYLSIPTDTTSDESRVYALQVDSSGWTQQSRHYGAAPLITRLTPDESFYKTYGVGIEGYLCEIEEEGYKDGIADATTHSYTVQSTDGTEESVTFTAALPGTGDLVKGVRAYKYDSDDETITDLGPVIFAVGSEAWLDDVSSLSANDVVFLGVYPAFYDTKSVDARTLTNLEKMWHFLDLHLREESSGTMHVIFRVLDEIGTKPWATTAKEGSVDLSESADARVDMNIGTERIVVAVGTIEPDPLQVYSWSLDYRQMGIF